MFIDPSNEQLAIAISQYQTPNRHPRIALADPIPTAPAAGFTSSPGASPSTHSHSSTTKGEPPKA